MGVQGLTNLLRRFAPGSLAEHQPARYRGWPVAIDAGLYLHRFVYAGKLQYPYPHVAGFYGLCRHLRAWKLRPIFVFDGETRPEAKRRESERRARLKDQADRELQAVRMRSRRIDATQALVSELGLLEEEERKAWSSLAMRNVHKSTGRSPLAGPLPDLATSGISSKVESLLEQQRQLLDETVEAASDKLPATEIAPELPVTEGEGEPSELQQYRLRPRPVDALPLTKTHRYLSSYEERLQHAVSRIGLPASEATLDSKMSLLRQRLERISADNHNSLVSLEKRTAYITADFVADAKRTIELMGYRHVTADAYEAEAVCVSLADMGIVRAVVSEDTDAAALGDYPLLRHFYVKGRPVLEMNFGVARNALQLTRKQFVDLCILCGTDFASKLKGVGPIRALKLIQQHGDIESVVAAVGDKYPPLEGFDYQQAREMFGSLPKLDRAAFLDKNGDIPIAPEDPMLATFLEQFEVDLDEESNESAYYDAASSDYSGIGPDPFAHSASL